MLAVCTIYSDLFLVNEDTGEILFTIADAGWECRISNDGRWVMCFNLEESCLKLIDTISGQIVHTVRESRANGGSLRRGCFSDDDTRILMAGQRFVEMTDLWTNTVFWHTDLPIWYMASLVTSGDGLFIAVEGGTEAVIVLDAFDGLIQTEIPKKMNFSGTTFANDGRELVMIHVDHLDIICTRTWTHIRSFVVDRRYSHAFDISPCSKSLVVMNKFNKVSLMDLAIGDLLPLCDRPCSQCENRCMCPQGSVVNAICFTADSKAVVTGHRDGHYRLWDARSGVMLAEKDLCCGVSSVQCSVGNARDELCLAFAMCQHERLGASSAAAILSMDELQLILGPSGRNLAM
jgi:WD40 repeat protein